MTGLRDLCKSGLVPPPSVDAAWAEAQAASHKAGVEVARIGGAEEIEALGSMMSHIWSGGQRQIVPTDLMTALAHAGQYLAGAWRGDELVGGSMAFTWGPGGGSRLHSHVTGVAPGAQNAGVGLALKLYQAAWALSEGITEITWTYDPLLRRNARFNLMKLGARVDSYHPDFYSELDDGINAGMPSDRLHVRWDLSDGLPAAPPAPRTRPDATTTLRVGPGGAPDLNPGGGVDGTAILCQIPADAVALRGRDPSLARRWQLALRAAMGGAMAAGFAVTSLTPDGHYLLEKP
jgi:predicted GNAT superfamily acetyltransferase